jgi:hypothetical protein
VDIPGNLKRSYLFFLFKCTFLILQLVFYGLQAMVHELIGIENNKVDLMGFANIPKDQQVNKFCISLM